MTKVQRSHVRSALTKPQRQRLGFLHLAKTFQVPVDYAEPARHGEHPYEVLTLIVRHADRDLRQYTIVEPFLDQPPWPWSQSAEPRWFGPLHRKIQSGKKIYDKGTRIPKMDFHITPWTGGQALFGYPNLLECLFFCSLYM